MKHKDLIDQLTETIKIGVEVGDTILAGRFKNKKVKVKSIGKDDHGMPTINGKKVVNFRIPKKDVFVDEGTRVQSHTFICSEVKIGKNCFIGHGAVSYPHLTLPTPPYV